MKKSTTMLDFIKRKCSTSNSSEVNVELPTTNVAILIPENADVPISQTQFQRIDLDSLDYDPGTRKQIWEYHVNQRDEIRWAYIKKGLHQPPLETFKKSGKQNRSFQASWYRNNSKHYKLVYRMVILVLTLPVSTATTERAFSAMKLVKIELRNKMEDDFLNDSLMLYIEKDIASTFSLDSTVDDFEDLKERRVPFS